MSSIRMFTLLNGQEIIATVPDTNDASSDTPYIVLQKVQAVVVKPISQDQYGLDMIPLSPSNPEGDQRLYRSAIAMEPVSVPVELEREYTRRTSMIEIVSALPGGVSL